MSDQFEDLKLDRRKNICTTVPQLIRCHMWFQHDGAPPHYGIRVQERSYHVFRYRWIGHGGPAPWPPRSSDLNSIDIFFGVR